MKWWSGPIKKVYEWSGMTASTSVFSPDKPIKLMMRKCYKGSSALPPLTFVHFRFSYSQRQLWFSSCMLSLLSSSPLRLYFEYYSELEECTRTINSKYSLCQITGTSSSFLRPLLRWYFRVNNSCGFVDILPVCIVYVNRQLILFLDCFK